MARWEIQLSTNSIQPYCDLKNLERSVPTPFPSYAMCMPRYSKLNGKYHNVKTIDKGNVGYVSNELSDASGHFKTPPQITLEFVRKKTSDGIELVFNQDTGDYASEVNVKYYLNQKLLLNQDYAPTSANYFCEAKVGMFNRVVVRFKRTNKPYRYVWLSKLANARLRAGKGLQIVYNDVAYLGKQGMTITSSHNESYSDYAPLKATEQFEDVPDYALCYKRYAKLDGDYKNTNQTPNTGFISRQISDASGHFSTNPKLVFTLNKYVSSIGIELQFNPYSTDYSDVKLKWYTREGVVEKEFSPTRASYFCKNLVKGYNKLEIEFLNTNKPYHPAFLHGIALGHYKVFTVDQIEDCTVYQQISLIGNKQPISTVDFKVREEDLVFNFERSQKTFVYYDEQIIGKYYLQKGERTDEVRYKIKAENVITLLDGKSHVGGFYNNASVESVVRELFKDIDEKLIFDDSVNNLTVSGWLPYQSARKNLTQVCMASGIVVDTSFENGVYVYKYNSEVTPRRFAKSEIYDNSTTIKHEKVITGVELGVHAWTKSEEARKLFEQELNGETTVVFKEPSHSYTIENGTIVTSHPNYVVIRGNGAKVLLQGKKYDKSVEIIKMETDEVVYDRKTLKVKDATLVTRVNAPQVLNRLYNYYYNNETLKTSVILNEALLSDTVIVESFEGDKRAVIDGMKIQFTGEMKASVDAKCI